MSYVFGPVASRRLGISLGVDLTPPKTCTYDCVYCQVGTTTCCTAEPNLFVPTGEVIRELEQKLEQVSPDVVTISGSGEPTLHSEIDQIIDYIRDSWDLKIALLTNGSLLWREEVRQKVLRAHRIMPTLSTAFEETFKLIHRPHPDIPLRKVIQGLTSLRREYRGEFFLEVMLLKGFNDSDREVEALKGVMEEIEPDRIQLNTVARPPADTRASSLDRKGLEDIKEYFGPSTEIIADAPSKGKDHPHGFLVGQVIEMAKRRPVRAMDVASALGISLALVERLVKTLEARGALRSKEHGGDLYYLVEALKDQQ